MKKVLTIAILTILTTTAAFANNDNDPKTTVKEETSKVVKTKETMKLIKRDYKKSSKMFREKNLMC